MVRSKYFKEKGSKKMVEVITAPKNNTITDDDCKIEEKNTELKKNLPQVEQTINFNRIGRVAVEAKSTYNNNYVTFKHSVSYSRRTSRSNGNGRSKTISFNMKAVFAIKSLFFAIAFRLCECVSYQPLRATTLEQHHHHQQAQQHHHQQKRKQQQRDLSQVLFLNFQPLTDVKDHARIDIDRKEMETEFDEGTEAGFINAKNIYENGANSGVLATLLLSESLDMELEKGTEVNGKSVLKKPQSAKLYENVGKGASAIKVQYQSSRDCRVNSMIPFLSGCFGATGTISLASPTKKMMNISYSYSIEEGTKNSRTLKGFSTNTCKTDAPSENLKKFVDYYGKCDYADHWIMSAFDGTKTDLKNGNADFSFYGREGRSEVIKSAALSMNIWMHIVQKVEESILSCESNCNEEGCNVRLIRSWDEAVAFYFGSLADLRQGSGYMPYSLANRVCSQFGTCGSLVFEQARANFDIMDQFLYGQANLKDGKCAAARNNKEAIVQIMTIPLIQGTLRSTYAFDVLDEKTEEKQAEIAVFAASILPMVHTCNPESATTIYTNLQLGKEKANTSFKEVKAALESVYDCLGINCVDVGGLVNKDRRRSGQQYLEDAEQCGLGMEYDQQQTNDENDINNQPIRSGSNIEWIIGASVSCVLIAAIILAGYEYFFGVKWY